MISLADDGVPQPNRAQAVFTAQACFNRDREYETANGSACSDARLALGLHFLRVEEANEPVTVPNLRVIANRGTND